MVRAIQGREGEPGAGSVTPRVSSLRASGGKDACKQANALQAGTAGQRRAPALLLPTAGQTIPGLAEV